MFKRYTPKRGAKGKWYTNLTQKHGGIHSVKVFKEAIHMVEETSADYRRPMLCHITFTGATREVYLDAKTRLSRILDDKGVRHRYKGAFEYAGDDGGLHFHLMLVVEHLDDGPNLLAMLSYEEYGLLKKIEREFGDISSLRLHIAKNLSTGSRFLYLHKTNDAILDEAVEWVSYIFKVRTKENVTKPIYVSSREKQKSLPTLH